MTKQMTQVLLSVVALVVIAAGVFLYFSSKNKANDKTVAPENKITDSNQDQAQKSMDSPPVVDQSDAGSFRGSFFDLANLGKTQKCNYSINQSGMNMEGTVYVAGKKMASSAKAVTGGMDFTTNMVGDGDKMHVWTSLAKTGYVMNYADFQKGSSTTPTMSSDDMSKAKEIMQKYDYKCDGWSVDESVFAIPADIKFTDASNMMTTPSMSNYMKPK